MVDPDALGTPDAGMLVDALVISVCSSPTAARGALAARDASPAVRAAAERVLAVVERQAPELSVVDRVGRGLDAASCAFGDRPDCRVLELIAACWNGENDPAAAADRLSLLIDASVGRLSLTIRDEFAYWSGRSGRRAEALVILTTVLDDRTRTLGPDHPDTLTTRFCIADELGELGRHDEALATLVAVADDRTRVLGPDHPSTLVTRHNIAYELGELGHHDEALAAFVAVAVDSTRTLGPDHPHTLFSRENLACQLGKLGRHPEALAAFVAVADDRTRVLGPDHPHTLVTHQNVACQLGELGRHAEALAAVVAVADDRTRVLGADHPSTLFARHNVAYELGELGHHDEALAAFVAVADDCMRVLGPDHPHTLATRHSVRSVAIKLLQTGRALPSAEARGVLALSAEVHLVRDLEAARDGSADAELRLPPELRSLVSELRAGSESGGARATPNDH